MHTVCELNLEVGFREAEIEVCIRGCGHGTSMPHRRIPAGRLRGRRIGGGWWDIGDGRWKG